MLAILNYTQAIKCKPMDADTYFRRGEMCETANRVLAIDDFSKVSCFTILPFIYFRSLYSHPNNIGNSWNSFVHVVWPNLIYFRLGPRTFIIGIDITTVTNAFFFFFLLFVRMGYVRVGCGALRVGCGGLRRGLAFSSSFPLNHEAVVK